MNKLLRIGELAQQTQVTVATIRYYESMHLIEPVKKTGNGYRYYDQTAVQRMQFIQQAKSLQFSLPEIRQVLEIRQHGQPVCLLVKALLDRKISELEANIQQAMILKLELENYRNNWDTRPIDNPSEVNVCSLIEEVPILKTL